MTTKSVLEEALDYLINDEQEKAVESFHNFIVRKAKEIHESLYEEDELDEELNQDEVEKEEEVKEGFEEEYFGSSDFAAEAEDEDLGDVEGVEGEEVDGGFDSEMGDEVVDRAEEVEGEEVTIGAEQQQEIMNSLDDLKAKFQEIMGGVAGDEVVDTAVDSEVEMGVDDLEGEEETEEGFNPYMESKEADEDEEIEEAVSHDAGVAAKSNAKTDHEGNHGEKTSVLHNGDAKLPESADFDFDLTEEDFMDLEEGLKAIDVKMGGEQGGVKFAGEETNTKSPVAQRSKSDIGADAKSMASKKSEHAGFSRESAPSVGSLPHSGDNSHESMNKTGSPARKEVKGAGGLEAQKGVKAGEQGGAKFAGTETNVKSPIGSAGTRNETGKGSKK